MIKPAFTANLLLFTVVLFMASAVAWASFTELDETTRGEGRVVPSRQIQVVQNLEGGIVHEIRVKQSELVKAGDVLLSLDPTRFQSELRSNQEEFRTLQVRIARLSAEAEMREPVFTPEMQAQAATAVAAEQALYLARLSELRANLRMLDTQMEQRRHAIEEARAAAESARRSLELSNNELAIMKPMVARGLEPQLSLLQIQQRINRASGDLESARLALARHSSALAEIVPMDDTLLIEANVLPSDIAFIHPGQEARVRLTAYEFSIYGSLDGHVEQITPDVIQVEQGNQNTKMYQVKVRTTCNFLPSAKGDLPIIPGMVAQVDIMTGKRSVMQYLLKPIMKVGYNAFHER